MKTLLIEEDRSLAMTESKLLAYEGIVANVEPDEQSALHRALDNDYDAIILNLKIPTLGGVELYRQVREAKPELPILVMSDAPSREPEFLSVVASADEYLSSPFNPAEFVSVVKALCNRPKSRISPMLA